MQLLEALLSKLRDYLETMKEFRFSTDLQVRSIKNTCFFFYSYGICDTSTATWGYIIHIHTNINIYIYQYKYI